MKENFSCVPESYHKHWEFNNYFANIFLADFFFLAKIFFVIPPDLSLPDLRPHFLE